MSATSGDLPAVVFLHGFTHTGASWEPVTEALGDHYQAFAPDIRGHGSSSDVRPVTLEAVLADLDALAPRQFTLVGYSQGGRVALHAAFAMRNRIRRVILIGASPGLADAQARAQRRRSDESLAEVAENAGLEEFIGRWAQTPVLADQSAEIQAQVMRDRLRNTPDGLAAALRGLGTGALPSLWPRLKSLTLPVDLIVGERDTKFRLTADRMALELPDARLHIVPGAGHAPHIENPEAVALLISATV